MSDRTFMYRLVFLEGPDKGRRVVIRQASVEAGSEPDLRIRLDDPAAREHHAVFIRDDGKVHVETSMGAQPFILNGEPLGRKPLTHGDVLELGRLRLQYQEMQPLIFHTRRRVSRLHVLTLLATAALLVVQAALLALVLLRFHEGPLPLPLDGDPVAEVVSQGDEASMPLLPELPSTTAEDDPAAADPEDDIFARAEVARPEPIADPVPTVIERLGITNEPAAAETPEPEEEPEPAPPVIVEEASAPAGEEEPPLRASGDDLPRRIRIVEVAREKFEAGEGLEEVRGARVVLRPRRSLGDIDPADVRLDVTFFDRDEFSKQVAPTLVPAGKSVPDLGDEWPAGEEMSLLYRYEVPKGFRTGDAAGHTYFGHSVQLYYRDRLEDVYAFPESLLEHP